MRHRPLRLALAAVVAVIAFNALLALVGSLIPHPTGPASSSYGTVPGGLAAWAELLHRDGHPVARMRRRPSATDLNPRDTVVVADPDAVSPGETRALAAFVRRGGHLVTGGDGPSWFAPLLRAPPKPVAAQLESASVLVRAPETAGVGRVAAFARQAWRVRGPTLAVLGARGGTLLAVARIGRGRVALMSDFEPLRNRRLAAADNAALALALAGGRRRRVVFMEAYHGFGPPRGLAGLPAAWRRALIGLAAAALVWVAAHVRRLGPPEPPARELPPSRRAYVDALSATLGRTRDSAAAAAAVRQAALSRLRRRGGLDPGAAPIEVRRAAERAGLAPDEVEALASATGDDAAALAAGRALAALGEGRGTT